MENICKNIAKACNILDFGCWKLKFALLDVAFDIISNGIVKCK